MGPSGQAFISGMKEEQQTIFSMDQGLLEFE
jgi:hypothetical protein